MGCPEKESRFAFFFSDVGSHRLREVVSNRSKSLFIKEVKDYGSETKSQNPCGRGSEYFCRILVCFSNTEIQNGKVRTFYMRTVALKEEENGRERTEHDG